jgi:Spy/CpxP family protein refolding chaperone
MEQDRHEAATPANNGKRRSRWIVASGIAVLALAGVGAAGAMGTMGGGGGMGHQMMEIGMRHGGNFAGRGLNRAFSAVDATAEQEDRIWAIIDDARAELRPMMREFRDTRAQALELMAAPAIEVLTPEQRAKFAEQLKERGGRRR